MTHVCFCSGQLHFGNTMPVFMNGGKVEAFMPDLYFDCSTGASGDMILAALIDCGLSMDKLKNTLAGLPLEGYTIRTLRTSKHGLSALQFKVEMTKKHPPRHLPQISELLGSSTLPGPVKEKILAVFRTLAAAEAKVHGIPEEKVHFHEIGAVDSIIDIAGIIIALEIMEIDSVYASPLPLGRGWVKTGHGQIPLPAPATMEIICHHRIPCYGLPLEEETLTPTGAAVLGTICSGFSPMPPMLVDKIGYGAGEKNFEYPNILRVFKGVPLHCASEKTILSSCGLEKNFGVEPLDIIEANIDDLNPEIYDYVLSQLFSSGALDVYFTPIQMKKNRPAVKVTVLANPQKSHELGQILLRETTTLGYRRQSAEKIMLPREQKTVETPWGKVRVKIAGIPPTYTNIAPEYEDCLRIAQGNGIPLKKVYQSVFALLNSSD